jgi:Protein of unknown function (DUF551)
MEWISVKDRLPNMGIDVLVYSKDRIFHAWWDNISSSHDWYDIQNTWIIEDVTHWMPLPKKPEE